tara:strand:- start:52 stop:306 length:255 start_codon:yes stop_codon:yes gene_type:complete
MFSLLRNETTNDSKPIISAPIQNKLAISTPIPIPKKSNIHFNKQNEYELNVNFFNPSKMSPPDCWKNRLEQRIQKLDYILLDNE